MLTRLFVVIVSCFSLTGCGSMLRAITDDPVRKEMIGPNEDKDALMGTLSLAANRRTVLVKLDTDMNVGFCAEPPPDTANEIQDLLEAKIEAEAKNDTSQTSVKGKGEGKSEYKTKVVQLSERTVLLDIYRTATYSLCQYHLNGAIKDNELSALYQDLTKRVFDAYTESVKSKTKEAGLYQALAEKALDAQVNKITTKETKESEEADKKLAK